MGVIAGSNPGQGPGASARVDPPIAPGEKVGLIGRNGVGKSTLFGLLDGRLHQDAGDFSSPGQWRLAQVAPRKCPRPTRQRPRS
jgi:ATPase subunit of ABC transporter with duplicated ATPase domains